MLLFPVVESNERDLAESNDLLIELLLVSEEDDIDENDGSF